MGVTDTLLFFQSPQAVKKKYTIPQTFGFNLVVHPAINSAEPTFFSRKVCVAQLEGFMSESHPHTTVLALCNGTDGGEDSLRAAGTLKHRQLD